MARPPIAISNGGIAGALTEGLVPAPDKNRISPEERTRAGEIILANVENLNARKPGQNPPVAKSLSGSNRKNDPRIYWRREDDKPDPKEVGLEAQ